MGPYNVFDCAKFDHHFLMMAVALGCSSAPQSIAHNHINFLALAFLVGEVIKLAMSDKEIDVFSMLDLVPIIVILI